LENKIKPGNFVKKDKETYFVGDTFTIEEPANCAHSEEVCISTKKAILYKVTKSGHIRGQDPKTNYWNLKPEDDKAQALTVNLDGLVLVPREHVKEIPKKVRAKKAHD